MPYDVAICCALSQCSAVLKDDMHWSGLQKLSGYKSGVWMQEYRPEVWRVWSDGEWLEYDLKGETEAVSAERLWAEAALQAQRRNNARHCLLNAPMLVACVFHQTVSSADTWLL